MTAQAKAKVESGVQLAERWIIAALRHRKFFSIEELNQAIRELRDRINQRPFRKREGSRTSQFAALDKPALNPLPAEPFDLSQWSRARVNIDYHIVFDTNFYSVPYNLVQELMEVRSTPTTVELFHKGQRVASHLRARGHGTPSPLPNTVRVPTRRIWSGLPPGWCTGPRPSAPTLRGFSSGS